MRISALPIRVTSAQRGAVKSASALVVWLSSACREVDSFYLPVVNKWTRKTWFASFTLSAVLSLSQVRYVPSGR
ncbi:hypothetical protein IF1G_05891 [Cordyceps javanica]|uniref:Uncharacterized protein n=1 Tax=Cordyceps javanica TaxID=43265 RepID=A0A545UZK7_9HYPO|nr:hypothetical protein IF1G_05891 [Cordyceps javanica]